MHLSETVPDLVCDTSRIDAITSLFNETVILAIDKYYWILSNHTMNTIDDKSKGFISHLIPGFKSLKLAVSIRTTLTGHSKELLFI